MWKKFNINRIQYMIPTDTIFEFLSENYGFKAICKTLFMF